MSFYNFAKSVTNGISHLMYHIEYEGLENIPEDGGYIVVSNHRSLWDPIFIAIKLKRQLFFMAKAELFKNKFFGGILKHLGAFPVERGKGDSTAIDHSIQILKENKILAIFPEGTRSKDGTPLRYKSGAAKIALVTKADVLPCCVDFTGKLKFRKRVTVRYGQLIPNKHLRSEEGEIKEIKEATSLIRSSVLTLLGVN